MGNLAKQRSATLTNRAGGARKALGGVFNRMGIGHSGLQVLSVHVYSHHTPSRLLRCCQLFCGGGQPVN